MSDRDPVVASTAPAPDHAEDPPEDPPKDPPEDPPKRPPERKGVREDLNTRRLIVTSLVAAIGLVGAVAALGYWLREPLLALGTSFVERFGGLGIAIGFAIPDAFTVPLPNDTFLALGLAGGMGDVPLILWGTFGSVMGGSLGWVLGRALRRTEWLRRFMTGRGAGLDRALKKHGIKVVAIAAVTPLPYSVSAWAAGSTFMPYRTFVTVSLLRVVRVVTSLYLIHLGLSGDVLRASRGRPD